MNLLQGLPYSVNIAGEEVSIETGYRTGLQFEALLRDSSLSDVEKLCKALDLYFIPGTIQPENLKEAVDAIINFYKCGNDTPTEEKQDAGERTEPLFSIEYDADYIYAAFIQAYGLDIAENNIHWWQFRALLKALPDYTMFSKIIGYRAAVVPPNATAEQRQRIEKLKRTYALPLDSDRRKALTDLEAILMSGGNPSSLLG